MLTSSATCIICEAQFLFWYENNKVENKRDWLFLQWKLLLWLLLSIKWQKIIIVTMLTLSLSIWLFVHYKIIIIIIIISSSFLNIIFFTQKQLWTPKANHNYYHYCYYVTTICYQASSYRVVKGKLKCIILLSRLFVASLFAS